jgi:Na+-transporting NADH:ubiquinone oxidoreductase subunit NqrB
MVRIDGTELEFTKGRVMSRLSVRHATKDPRHYQIAVLMMLFLYGVNFLAFEVSLARASLILLSALATQYLCTYLWRLPAFDPRSALVSALSLCLLLRTNQPVLASAAAVLAIASKFLIRRGDKHLFNPTNFSLVVLMLLSNQVWVSTGQWGSGVFLAFFLACLGGLVVHRAARSDLSLSFLGFYLLILMGRMFWLGESARIVWHQLQNGTLLIFAFFMISDPKTTPSSRLGRILFSLLVAIGAASIQFVFFRTNGLLWSLAACASVVPFLDRYLPGNHYQWYPCASSSQRKLGGVHETPSDFRNCTVESHSIFSHPS